MKFAIATLCALGLAAAPALAQPNPPSSDHVQTKEPGPAAGNTSGPAAGQPATMNMGNGGGAPVTGSPHQKDVLRDKGNPEGKPGSNGNAENGTGNANGDNASNSNSYSGNPHR